MMDYDRPFTHQSQGQAFYKLTAAKWSIDSISNKQVLWSPPLKYNPSFFFPRDVNLICSHLLQLLPGTWKSFLNIHVIFILVIHSTQHASPQIESPAKLEKDPSIAAETMGGHLTFLFFY